MCPTNEMKPTPEDAITKFVRIFGDSRKTYNEKVDILLKTWKYYYDYSSETETLEIFNDALQIIHKASVEIIVNAEWKTLMPILKRKLIAVLKRSMLLFSKKYPENVKKCKFLKCMIQDPWSRNSPSSETLLDTQRSTDNKVSSFIDTEGDEMLLLRLEALCEDKCDDLALKLAASYEKHMNLPSINQKLDVNHINDIVLVLLYKYDKTQEIIEKVKTMKLSDGLDLLQRFKGHCNSVKRIWQYSDKVTEIASHTILASAMVKSVAGDEDHKLLHDLISQWALIHIPKFIINNSMAPIENMVRKIIKTAESSLHIYIFTQVLRKQFGDKVKTLCVELYIRALTANMNEIEQQKVRNDIPKISESENLLADGFLQVGELLCSNDYVCRECLLTAFSLNPTRDCLDRIRVLAVSNNNNSSSLRSKVNSTRIIDFTDSSNNKDKCSIHGIPCCNCSMSNENSSAEIGLNLLDSELCGLPPHLADDLSTVLTAPRSQLLSWSMGWEQLVKECEQYLLEHSRLRFQNKELKYLNLDYSQFKDWPSKNQVTSGIEKGYEHLVEVPKAKKKRRKSVNTVQKATNIDNNDETSGAKYQSTFTPNDNKSSQFTSTSSITRPTTSFEKGKMNKNTNMSRMISSSSKIEQPLTNKLIKTIASVKKDNKQSVNNIKLINHSKKNEEKIKINSLIQISTDNKKEDSSLVAVKLVQRMPSNPGNSNLGSSVSCTTPVSKTEDRKKWNRKMNCNVYSNKSSSPTPAEVPPTGFSDSVIKNKFIPIYHSLNMNSKLVVTDVANHKKIQNSPKNGFRKSDFASKGDRGKLDILAQAVMRSDILLAKSVPGMNSVDMIIPQPQEATVQVVQISSNNSLLTQSVSNTSVATSIQSNSGHTRTKPVNETITETSRSHVLSNQTVELGSMSECRPIATYSIQTNQSAVASHASSAITTSSEPRITSAQIILNNSSLVSNRPQTLKPNLVSPSASDQSSECVGESAVELVGNASSQNDPSSHVSSHIQSVGQPHKLRTTDSSSSKLNNSVSSGSQTSSNTQALEESQKPQNQTTNPVYRLVVKDGRVIEQYFQSNQSLDPVLSIPDNGGSENVAIVNQPYNQSQFIKFINRKKEFKQKEEIHSNKTVDSEILPSSLPKFHHVFGRQIYQSGPTISVDGTNVMSSQSQFENSSVNDKLETRSATPLSKAVQTVPKECESPVKSGTEKRSDVVVSNSQNVTATNSLSNNDLKETRPSSEAQQPSSGVIFTCKVPISLSNSGILQGKPVTILKATSSSDVIIPSSKIENDRNKDSVIRSNMNALLAAALQSAPPIKHSVISNNANSNQQNTNVKHIKIGNMESTKNPELLGMTKIRMPTPAPKTFRRQPMVHQQGPSRFVRPLLQVSTGNSMTQTGPPVVTIPLPARTVVLAANLNQNSLPNLSKIERRDQLNTDQSVSSTTLEQLREFESVLEQVTNTSQMKERGSVKKADQNTAHSNDNADFNPSTSKVNQIFQSSIVSTISDLNTERVSLTFISKPNSSNNSVNNPSTLTTSNTPKITSNTPVVVVQSCSRPLASPALSIASQSSSSPAPQTPPANTQPKISAKVNKPKTKSSVGKTAPTTTLKVSTLPKPQQKPQEDEQTTQRIYAILDKYAEQLRNSPELKNKPAPRRRSNPPTNPTQSSKRKKSSQNKSKGISNMPSCSGLEMSPGSEDLRTLGSEDSSNGVSQISQLANSPQSKHDEHSNPAGDVSSETSESLDSKDQRSQHRILLAEPSQNSSRTVLVQENIQPMINVEGTKVLAGKQLVVGSGATVPLTLSLPVAGNVKQVIFPVPADGRFVVAKGPKMYRVHQVTMPSGSPLLATASSGAVVLRQMCLNKSNSTVKQVKLPVVSQIPAQSLGNISGQPAVVLPSGSQSFTLSTNSGLEAESLGIALDNTILLNTSTSSSLGFFQRNVNKSGQQSTSPNNVFTNTNKPSCSVDQNSSSFSSNSDIQSSLLKNESSLGLHHTMESQAKKRINISSQCEVDYKPKTEGIQFSIAGDSDKLVSNSSFISTSSKSWSQMLKDVKGDVILDNAIDKKLSGECHIKKEFPDDKDSTKDVKLSKDGKNVKTLHSESLLKQKKTDDTNPFREERNISCETQSSKGQTLQNHCANNQQWQFGTKLDKTVKAGSISPSVHDSKTQTIIQTAGPLGLKRKLNVENTIFQVAFKRSDRLKLIKDDFIQQRHSSLSLERELRLQKSLSEECEDLGVDKPSTSDLFPEAELLLDSDPLSRDSLQELYSRGMESSSSSHDSPNRCSPPVSSDTVSSRFSGSSWRKHKKDLCKQQLPDLDHLERDALSISKECSLDQKSDSSCEASPINGGSGNLNILCNEPKPLTSGIITFKNNLQNTDSSRLNCGQQTEVSNLNLESHDSDNFSEADDNCNDILDTEGDSDSELHSSCKQTGLGGISDVLTENDTSDKCDPGNQSPNMLSCGNCTFTYQNYLQKEKVHDETSSPWFHVVKSQQRSNDLEDDIVKPSRCESLSDCHTPNGILDDSRSDNSPKEHSPSDCDLLCGHSVRHSKHSSSLKEEDNLARGRKRKKLGMYITNMGEDSGSSLDTILTGSDECLDIDRLSRRSTSSSRGRNKKGCPCFNGNQDIKKKKDLVGGSNLKTEKTGSSKTVSYQQVNSKKTNKPIVKTLNKKR